MVPAVLHVIYHCMFASMLIFRKDQGIFMDKENQSSDIGAVDLQTFIRGLRRQSVGSRLMMANIDAQ